MRHGFFAASAIVSILFFSAAASAQPVDFSRMQSIRLPDDVGNLIGDARVNIYDYENGGIGSIVVASGIVKQASNATLNDPTHKIYVRDAATLQRIFDAPDILKEFNRQRSVHGVRIEALDFDGQVKLAIGTIIASLISLFTPPE